MKKFFGLGCIFDQHAGEPVCKGGEPYGKGKGSQGGGAKGQSSKDSGSPQWPARTKGAEGKGKGTSAHTARVAPQGKGAGTVAHAPMVAPVCVFPATLKTTEERQQMIEALKCMGYDEALARSTVAKCSTPMQAIERLMMEAPAKSTVAPMPVASPVTPARAQGHVHARGQWQWGSGGKDGKWSDYDAKTCELLTEAYLEGRAEVLLVHDFYGKSGGYIVDLAKMMQTRIEGAGNARPVRGKVDGADAKPVGATPPTARSEPASDLVARVESQDFIAVAEVVSVAAQSYEWRDHKGWHKYEPSISAAIAAGVREHKQTVPVTIAGRPYEIDLVGMVQKNVASGATRDVRPATEATAPATDVTKLKAIWEVCKDAEHDEWIMYDETAIAALERAYGEGSKGNVTISAVNGLKYEVILSDPPVQMSRHGNSRRPVRRTPITVPTAVPTGSRFASTYGPRTWQQHVGGGRWTALGAGQTSQLEEAFLRSSAEGVEAVAEDGGRILVDFEKLIAELKGTEGSGDTASESGVVTGTGAATGSQGRRELRRLPPSGAAGFEEFETGKARKAFDDVKRSQKSFHDDQFSGVTALFADAAKATPVDSWKRPKDIRGLGTASVLLHDDVLPRDVRQGSIGDCWIVSVLAVIAAQPRLLKNLFPVGWDAKCGAAIVRLCMAGLWHELLIDDLFPCRRDGSLIYMSNNRQQLWAPMVEKAYAKLLGSYETLIGGQMYEAMGTLTGYVCDDVDLAEKPVEAAWMYVTSYLSKHFLLCTSVKSKADAEAAKALGLVTRHAYSVLDFHSGDVRLVALRNPHSHGVWKGDWSDLSPRWDEPGAPELRHDGVRQKPPTGRFWISFEDFLFWFGSVQYCKVRPESWSDFRMNVSLAPPDLLGDRVHALRFGVDKDTNVELSMLQVGKRGIGCLPGHIDIGFGLLRCTAAAEQGTSVVVDSERFQLVTDCSRNTHGCVSLELELPAGEYMIVPQVFAGRRAARPGTNQDRATIVVHSEHPLKVPRTIGGLPAATTRDVAILRALATPEPYMSSGDDGNLWVLKEPSGHTVVAVNQSKRFGLRVSIFADKSLRVDSSRGSLRTLDVVPPGHAQVLQIITFGIHTSGPKSITWSVKARPVMHDGKTLHEPSLQQALHEAVPWPM